MVRGADRTLGLADAFDRSDWEEGNFTPVGSTTDAQALAATVNCSSSRPRVLEFRFSGTDGYTLRASVAQELHSPNPSATLEFALVLDDRQTSTKSIKFKQSAELTADLTGVAVVQLTVKHPDGVDELCEKPITALVTKLVMTSG